MTKSIPGASSSVGVGAHNTNSSLRGGYMTKSIPGASSSVGGGGGGGSQYY